MEKLVLREGGQGECQRLEAVSGWYRMTYIQNIYEIKIKKGRIEKAIFLISIMSLGEKGWWWVTLVNAIKR